MVIDIGLEAHPDGTDYSTTAQILEQMNKRHNTGGTKHDSGKPDLSLVPRVLMEATAQALMFGENKYGRYNYLRGFPNHRLIAACLRHLTAYQDGEDLDPESNLPHLSHAVACLAMLMHCAQVGTLTDTRFK